MSEKWIGQEDDRSGSYVRTVCEELMLRKGGKINAKRLYKFESRFGEKYYITDINAINTIESLLEKEDTYKIYEFLYGLVIEKTGVMEFILNIEHKISRERDSGYRNGKLQMQKEIRNVLGIG